MSFHGELRSEQRVAADVLADHDTAEIFDPATETFSELASPMAHTHATHAMLDVLKLAMIAVDHRLRAEHPTARLLLTVHDELVLEVPAGDAEAVGELVRDEMTGIAELSVPLVADVGSGPTWYEAKVG